MKRYIVINAFLDKDDRSKRYEPGDELPDTLDEERLANIVGLGLAKVEDDEPKVPKEPKEPKAPKEPVNE